MEEADDRMREVARLGARSWELASVSWILDVMRQRFQTAHGMEWKDDVLDMREQRDACRAIERPGGAYPAHNL